MRARSRAEQASRRAQTVVAYRQYRKGELPDIQISKRDLLAPLQALVHHDTLVAKLCFGELYTSVRKAHFDSGGPMADEAMASLHGGIERLLGSRHGEAAFVGCLHELALSEVDSDCRWLRASTVASSARASGNLHSGVRILERQLEAAGGAAASSGQRGGKKPRDSASSDAGGAATRAERGEEMEVKMHLAELYRGVGEEDVVRGIAHELTTSRDLRAALEAEMKGDAEQALSYTAALEEAREATLDGALGASFGGATGDRRGGGSAGGGARGGVGGVGGADGAGGSAMGRWERELAQRGVLQARTLLAKWGEIAHETRLHMAQACGDDGVKSERDETDAGRAAAPVPSATTFRGSLAQSWVRLWAVSHAKAAAAATSVSHGEDVGWGSWPVSSVLPAASNAGDAMDLDPPLHPLGAPQPRRDAEKLLQAGHGSLLLLDRLASDDVNGMRSLLPRCAHAFVRRWATLHPLAEGARKAELRPLQIFAEAAELASLLEEVPPIRPDASSAVGCAVSPQYTRLLSTWSARLPSVAYHDAGAWDDLICARKRMVATLRQSVIRALGEQRSGGSGYLEADERESVLKAFETDVHRCMLRCTRPPPRRRASRATTQRREPT